MTIGTGVALAAMWLAIGVIGMHSPVIAGMIGMIIGGVVTVIAALSDGFKS